jgi:hypothetical protein
MRTLKLNFTIPEDVAAMLKARVGKRGRSAFVGATLRDRLNQLEQEQLKQTLIEGYLARRSEDAEVSEEWEMPTLEGWR